MTITPTTPQLTAMGHDHHVWINGLRAGRDSMYLCETLEEAEARSPYLVDGQDPINAVFDRLAEREEG